MKLWKILTYFIVIFLGAFYASGFGHSFLVNSEWTYEDIQHTPDHEISHSEDTVYRWTIIGNGNEPYSDIIKGDIALIYNDKNLVNHEKDIITKEKIFDKQSFFFSDTVRLIL